MEYHVALGIATVLIFITLLVLFCAVLIKLYVHKIKTYTEVIFQKDIEFQKTLNTAIIETQEQVLTNISRDLHDDAGQQLTYINFQIENLKLDSPELHALLDPLSQSVANLSKSVRGISHSLNSQLLGRQDVIKAIRSESERLNKLGRIKVHCKVYNSSALEFNANEKIIIFRIFQELINNILKHAAAKNIHIKIDGTNSFQMEVTDDGKGFDENGIAQSNSIGLQNIRTRASYINYKIEIESLPGNGTRVLLSRK